MTGLACVTPQPHQEYLNQEASMMFLGAEPHCATHSLNGKLMLCPASFLISMRLVTGMFANIATVKSPAICTLLTCRNSRNNRSMFFRLHQSSKSHRVASDLSNLNQPELELHNVYLSNLQNTVSLWLSGYPFDYSNSESILLSVLKSTTKRKETIQ